MSASPAPGPAPARPTPPALVLDPVDRLSEILFGLIMALSVTCTLSASSGARFTRLPWGKASVDSLTVGGEIESSGQAKILRAGRRREAARRVGWSWRVVILQVVRGVA